MKATYLTLVILLFIQCTANNDKSRVSKQKIDLEFKSNFDNCIQIITLRQLNFNADYWNMVYAFHCLRAVTGVNSNVVIEGDSPYFYPTLEDKDFTEFFYEDLIKWNEWYEKNKFSITMSKSDSLINRHSEMIGEKIQWPQSSTILFSAVPRSTQK